MKKGLTLVEIAVIIAICGILASLLVPAIMSVRAKAKAARAAADKKAGRPAPPEPERPKNPNWWEGQK